MKIQQLLWQLVDWYIPDHAKQDAGDKLRAQLTVSMLFIVIPFHIGPIIKYMAINSPVVYVNFAHIVVCITLTAVMKASGRTTIVAYTLLITLLIQEGASVYFSGGLRSNVQGLIMVVPVAATLLIGFQAGILLFIMSVGFMYGIYYLTLLGHVFPAYNVSPEALFTEKYYYVFAVITGFTILGIVFQGIKNATLRDQQEAQVKSVALAEHVQGLINEIGINSAGVASASEELSRSSIEIQKHADQISISESQTSASTNQSASTIQELSSSLRMISKRMQDLRRVANTAEDEGQLGSDIIVDSNQMMQQIEQSSQQIENITMIITDIAEQTNLLSLNAAIEADKAGDFGMGFAIVAEEVGELAERSNDAAGRISELIRKSDVNVSEGKEIIQKTGQMLEVIIEGVRNVALEVNQLVTAISEQDIGTREVAKGADEISEKSERSLELINHLAVLVGDSNKAIGELSKIADDLDNQVTLYKA